MKTIVPILLMMAFSAVQSWGEEIIARTELGRYTITLVPSGSPYTDTCNLRLIAEADNFRRSTELRRPFYHCALYGRVQVIGSWEPKDDSATIFVEARRGGDGDHTGPIVEVFRLTPKGFTKLGEIELFDATYVRLEEKISTVWGKMVFNFCDVCDGPEVSEEKVFVSVQVDVGASGLKVRNTLDEGAKAAVKRQFAEMKRSALARQGQDRRTYEKYVRELERRFLKLLAN